MDFSETSKTIWQLAFDAHNFGALFLAMYMPDVTYISHCLGLQGHICPSGATYQNLLSKYGYLFLQTYSNFLKD